MHRSIVALPLAALLLAGCAATPVPTEPSPTAFAPVSVDNCGFALEVATPPERIVAIKSTSTELLLALGLEDKIIGTAFQDGPLPEEYADVELPVVAERMPSEEALLELEPDFVFSGWESAFTAEAAGERGELDALGIGSYVSPPACKGEGYKPAQLSWDDVFASITEAGAIFDAQDAATEIVESQTAIVDGIEADDRGLTALWWSSGTDTPYVGAGIGAPQLMLDTIGVGNIAGDINDTWSPFNWEAVIAANPDVIVLVDASWNTAAAKKEYLASNPATAALDAVVNERYLVIPFPAGEAGVRSAPATADLAEQLAALAL